MKFTCHTLIKRETLLFFAIAPALLSAADKVVKVSNFKPDRANATVAVQHAIDAGAKTVIFDNPGFDYLVGPITLRSDRELIFEDGVHVRALPGGFKDRNACLFKGSGVKNVVMRGRGNAVLSMNKRDYQNPKLYDLGEWRHTVSLFGCRNVTIKDLTIRSSGGDGVYIAKGKRPLMENNILLENLLLDDHHRQGVSVISVNGLVIRKCRIQNTNGTPPMCGIDFEPNNASEEVSNCLIEETEFLNNATAGISFYCKHLKKPLNVTIRNCRITGIEGISISDVDAGTIRFENCKIVDCKLPIIIRNKRSGVATSFSGCEIDNRSGKADIPIRIFTEFRENCGGIDFGKFLIRQTPERKIMTFEAVRGAGLDLPAGEITVINSGEKNSVFDLRKFAKGHRPNPELLNFKTSPVRLTDYIPIQRKGQRKGHTFSIRRAVFFVQYCDGKNPVKLRFKTAWKRKKTAMSPMQLEIFCPAGTSNGTVAIDKDDFTYELKGSRGVYRFRLKTGGRAVNIESSAPGFGFEADSKLRLLGSTGTFYFYVPANVTTFAVQFQGEIGEAVEAELVDPSGKVRSTIRCEADAQILKGERPENSPAEIWSIRIPYAKDDYSIRLGAPLPPILYTVPENVLVPKNRDKEQWKKSQVTSMREVTVAADFSKRLKEKIKPLHGVNNSPVSLYNPPPGFKEAGIPFCRLHDTAGSYGGAHYVDIPNVFPDFDADPEKPESYDFAFTDAYLTQLHAAGTEIFYRLGVTIENNYRIKGYHNHPPKDYTKWAEICAGIVRHYNCGWANGFKFGIKYWEIWNEPENPPMWDGTQHEFFELYRTASNRLKKEFPEIKVGGYGSCGFYVLTQPDRAKEPRFQLFMKWFEDFLKFVTSKKTACPLDFFSWHLYSLNPGEIAVHAHYVDSKLKDYGLKNVEIILDEWNYVGRGFSVMKKAEGASFVASAFCRMQDSPIDKAMYYDAYPKRAYCGLYYFPEVSTTKTYSAFFLWNRLYRLGTRCKTEVSGGKIYVCAATGGSDKALLITNFSPESCKIVLDLKGVEPQNLTGLLVDNRHDRTAIVPQSEMVLAPFAVLLLQTAGNKTDRIVPVRKDTAAFAGIDVSCPGRKQREMR